MALSYSAILRVPQSYTLTTFYYVDGYEFASSTTSSVPDIVTMLGLLKTSHETYYGGTFSWVISADATYDIYTISWTGLTVDPELAPPLTGGSILGNPVMMFCQDETDPSFVFATQYFSTEQCEATGSCTPCPPSVNPDDATDCLSCYPLEIEFCASTFDIEGLEADTEYTIKIKDNVSNKTYDYVATSDQYGIIEITTANYPTGVFTPFNSPLSITILDANGDPVILTYGYVNYSCLELNVTNTTTIV
jgi:hypothetical protein